MIPVTLDLMARHLVCTRDTKDGRAYTTTLSLRLVFSFHSKLSQSHTLVMADNHARICVFHGSRSVVAFEVPETNVTVNQVSSMLSLDWVVEAKSIQ